MLRDAIAAERFRLLRDRSTLFWGFCFAPLVGFALSLGGDLFLHHVIQRPMPAAKVGLLEQVLKAVASGGATFGALFLMIGAAAVLAGDYRWETWRLLTPRNTRPNLLLAKLIVVGEAIFWSLLLTAVLSALAAFLGSAINGVTLVSSTSGRGLVDVAGVLAITWLEVMSLAALAACVAVLSRSTLGVVIACLGVRFVEGALSTVLRMMEPPTSWKLLVLPAYSADLLRAGFFAPAQLEFTAGAAAPALIVLVLWIAGLTAGAVAMFRRQDLTRE